MVSRLKTDWHIYALLLLLAYIIVYLLPLGVRPLMVPDELRYAEIPREMLASGNWVVPHLNGLRYFEKPVMGYWTVALSMQLFGENAFAVRLPSALAAGLSALTIFLLMRRSGQRHETALSASMIYLSLLGVFLIGGYNILDSVFSFLLGAAFTAFYFSHVEVRQRRRTLALIAMGVFCGAAFLTKGFLAFVLLGIVIVPFVIWQRRWSELFSRGWIPPLVAILVVAPWALMIHQQAPDFWHYFFWEEHIKRFFSDNAQHEEPFWFYFAFLPLLAWPWIWQSLVAVKGLWLKKSTVDQAGNESSLVVYALLWFLLPLLFFSISRGKLPTYILPCLVPLAILFSIGLQRCHSADGNTACGFRYGAIIAALIPAGMAVFLLVSPTDSSGRLFWQAADDWKRLLLSAALFSGAGLMLISAWLRAARVQDNQVQPNQSQPERVPPWYMFRRLSLFGGSIVPLLLVLIGSLPQRTIETKVPGILLENSGIPVTDNTLIVTDDSMIHAVNWYFHRSDVYMTSAGELNYGLTYADASDRFLEGDRFKQFLARNVNHKPIVVVFKGLSNKNIAAIMPPQAIKKTRGRFSLWYIPVVDTP